MADSARSGELAGRVVFVAGASAGVGRAVARRFAEHGASVGLFARGQERLSAAPKEVDAAGGRVHVCVGDVSDPEQVERAAGEVESALGPIDVWVNNAIVTVMSTIADSTPDDFRRVIAVAYLGTVPGTLAALRRMRPRNRGVIVQVDEPVPGDPGAHGRFDDRAKGRSRQLWLTMHRRALAAAGLGGAAVVLLLWTAVW